MADAAAEAIGKLDGRDPNAPNYPPLNWVGVTMYQPWDLGQDWVNRPAGADNNAPPANGAQWWSSSMVDHNTVLAEILTKKFRGEYTVLHMISALFAVQVLGEDPADVRAALGVADNTAPLA